MTNYFSFKLKLYDQFWNLTLINYFNGIARSDCMLYNFFCIFVIIYHRNCCMVEWLRVTNPKWNWHSRATDKLTNPNDSPWVRHGTDCRRWRDPFCFARRRSRHRHRASLGTRDDQRFRNDFGVDVVNQHQLVIRRRSCRECPWAMFARWNAWYRPRSYDSCLGNKNRHFLFFYWKCLRCNQR